MQRNGTFLGGKWWLTVIAIVGTSGCGMIEVPAPDDGVTSSPPAISSSRAGKGGSWGSTRTGPIASSNVGIVAAGENLQSFGRRFHASSASLIQLNNLSPPYRLETGQRLVLPLDVEHEVQAGDTLYGIAGRYGVDANGIASANGLTSPDAVRKGQPESVIRIGEWLRIPGARLESLPETMVAGVPATESGGERAAVAPPPPVEPKSAEEVERKIASQTTASTPAPQPKTETAPPSSSAAVTPPPPPPPITEGNGMFTWPVTGQVISRFGSKGHGQFNDGINIAAPQGTPVRAAESGVVAYAGNELRGFGNMLMIKHADGWVTFYAHNDVLLVDKGARVRKGQTIARVGSTGNVDSPQLHFQIRRNKRAVDPLQYLDRPTAGPVTNRKRSEVSG